MILGKIMEGVQGYDQLPPPVSDTVDEKILCMHGGLIPEFERLKQIADVSVKS